MRILKDKNVCYGHRKMKFKVCLITNPSEKRSDENLETIFDVAPQPCKIICIFFSYLTNENHCILKRRTKNCAKVRI